MCGSDAPTVPVFLSLPTNSVALENEYIWPNVVF